MALRSYTGVQPKFTNRIKTSQIKYVCDVQSSLPASSNETTYKDLKDFNDVWSSQSGSLPNIQEEVTEGTFVTHFTPSNTSNRTQSPTSYNAGTNLDPFDQNPFTYLTIPVKPTDRNAQNNLDRVLQECALHVEGTVFFRESIIGIKDPNLNPTAPPPLFGAAIEFEHYGIRTWYDYQGTSTQQKYTKFWVSNFNPIQFTRFSPSNVLNSEQTTLNSRNLIENESSIPIFNLGSSGELMIPPFHHPILFNYEKNWWECKLLINKLVNSPPLDGLNPDKPYSIIVKGKYLLM